MLRQCSPCVRRPWQPRRSYTNFLSYGSTLVSYGDFARVADRVVFSIPIGGLDEPSPALHLVSISESSVDWERTDQYAEATRARHYAATQGEVDFDALSTEVARALHDVATTKIPRAGWRSPPMPAACSGRGLRLTMDTGRRTSRQLTSLLDDAVGDLRVAAGLPRLDLTLVATASPLPPAVPELPPPTLRESIEQAFRAASVTDDPAERVSLLEAIVAGCRNAVAKALGKAEAPTRRRTGRRCSMPGPRPRCCRSSRPTRATVTSSSRTVTTADERARRADVDGIERARRDGAQGRRSARPPPAADDRRAARDARRPARRRATPAAARATRGPCAAKA